MTWHAVAACESAAQGRVEEEEEEEEEEGGQKTDCGFPQKTACQQCC